MKVIAATVVLGSGPDKVFLATELPDPCWPYKASLVLEFSAAYNTGVDYVKQQFGVDALIVQRTERPKTVAKRHPQWDV